LIINDEPELVSICDCLHLGQEDLSKISLDKKEAIRSIREKIKDKILGISTHNIDEIKEANELDIDYIGLGAYRSTSTKDVSLVLGDQISYIASFSQHPVVAIGGVRVDDNIKNISFNAIGLNLYEY
jgi:thiamine-phosphate pyrophosphorylase